MNLENSGKTTTETRILTEDPPSGSEKPHDGVSFEGRKTGHTKIETKTVEGSSSDKKIMTERRVTTKASTNDEVANESSNDKATKKSNNVSETVSYINAKSVCNDEAKKKWKSTKNKHRIIISPGDYFDLTGNNDTYGNININDEAYAVTSDENMKKGRILIPDIFRNVFPLDREFKLSVIAKKPLDIKSIAMDVFEPELDSPPTERIKSNHASCDEASETPSDGAYEISSSAQAKINNVIKTEIKLDSKALASLEPDHSLTLSKNNLDIIVRKFLADNFVVEIGRKYPFDILHDVSYENSDDPIKKGTSDSAPRRIDISFSPSKHTLQDMANDKEKREKTEYTKEQILNTKRFISSPGCRESFYSADYPYFSPVSPRPKLMSDKVIEYQICSELHGDNRIHVSSALLRSMQDDENFTSARFLVKIGKFYHFTAAHNNWGEDSYHNLEAMTNLSFYANYGLKNQPDLKQSDKKLTPATNISIHLNWLSGDRKQLSLKEEQVKEFVRKALEDVPLQIDRKFQVKVILPEPLGGERFVIEGKVTAVSGKTINSTSSIESDSEPLFICTQSSTLDLTAEEACILNGSATGESTREYYMDKMTSGLVGLHKPAREAVDKVIIRREKFENGKADGYHKGVVFYGPMGNGKSQMAENLFHAITSKVAGCHKRVVIPGSVVGSTGKDTTENLEALFASAKEDAIKSREEGKLSKLHVFLLDEIDGFIPIGTKTAEAAVEVEQALNGYLKNIMSSSFALNNIIIIGTTNSNPREYDDALLRPERFSVLINIDNPDEAQRIDLIRHFLSKSKSPAAFIDETSEKMCATITGNYSAIGIKSLIEDSVEPASKKTGKNKIKIEMSHIYDALHPEDQVVLSKQNSLKMLKDLDASYRDSLDFDDEVNELNSFNTKINQVLEYPKRHTLFFVQGSNNSRSARFCHDLLQKCNKAYQYDVYSSIRHVTVALLNSINSHKSIIVLHDVETIMKLHKGSEDKLKAIGQAWERVKLSKTSSTAFVLTCPVEKDDQVYMVKHALGIEDQFHHRCALVERYSKAEMIQVLKTEYPAASRDTISQVVELFGQNFPIKTFEELTNGYYYHKEDNSLHWHINDIQQQLNVRDYHPLGYLFS